MSANNNSKIADNIKKYRNKLGISHQMMNKRTAVILITFLLLGIGVYVGIYWRNEKGNDRENGALITYTYASNDKIFNNPERGFHGNVNLNSNSNYSWLSKEYTLVRAYVRLDDFRDSPIDDYFLRELELGLARLRTDGLKVILRFAYNFGPIGAPDAPKGIILQHINQLEPILKEYADVIAVVQAGFVGTWGEWHNSTNGLDNDKDHRDIATALLDALPETRMIQVRTPYWKAGMYNNYNPISSNEAYTDTYRARTGQHNDCFLTSADDTGTYNLPFGPNPAHDAPSDVLAWKNFTAADTTYTPMGGETCQRVEQRSDCTTTLKEMEQMHFSYLNDDFYQPVLDGWKNNGCYNEISRRMGYRFELKQAEFLDRAAPGQKISVQIDLVNSGWAPLYNPRPIYLVLTNGSERLETKVAIDPRRWEAGTKALFATDVQIPTDFPSGNYELSLWLPDYYENLQADARYSIRFANEDVWDAENGYNKLGEITIGE